jgi:hypothetical protein
VFAWELLAISSTIKLSAFGQHMVTDYLSFRNTREI